MSTLIIDVPEDLAHRLQPYTNHLSTILEVGLDQFDPGQLMITEPDFSAEFDGILDFLQSSPAPEAIIALRTSKALQVKISELLEKNRNQGLSTGEETWWKKFEHVEHLVRIAKAKAFAQLRG